MSAEQKVHESEDNALRQVLERIDGSTIERHLLDLAAIGGKPIMPTLEQPERYSVTRLALSPVDILARDKIIKPFMEEVGMEVLRHPFGLIGTLKGNNPELSPLVILSHTDSVKNGDMYDGTVGVIGPLVGVKALVESGVELERDIIILALTAEESAAFGMALIGSRSMFHGLTDEELNMSNGEDPSLAEVLTAQEIEQVMQPIFGPRGHDILTPLAAMELHVEQDSTLDSRPADVGIVTAIAAAIRHEIIIGDEALAPDEREYPHARYLELAVSGKADHSGATPMGQERRADGLVETASVIRSVIDQSGIPGLAIGEIIINGQTINTIPGHTRTILRVSSESDVETQAALDRLRTKLAERNQQQRVSGSAFDASHLSLQELADKPDAVFFPPEKIRRRQEAALVLAQMASEIATGYSSQNVVSTVTKLNTTPEGRIKLRLDTRGIEKQSRDEAFEAIRRRALDALGPLAATIAFSEPLAGSGDPVDMEQSLINRARLMIGRHQDLIGESMLLFSAAGHDTQNVARAGIPSIMLFTPSRAGGKAHNPDAYSTPKDLENGVRALTTLIYDLAAAGAS